MNANSVKTMRINPFNYIFKRYRVISRFASNEVYVYTPQIRVFFSWRYLMINHTGRVVISDTSYHNFESKQKALNVITQWKEEKWKNKITIDYI